MFSFKQFSLSDTRSGMKIGTDGVLLGAWVQIPSHAGRIVDAGAGCGLIALMLAQRSSSAEIYAVEISPDACADCIDNISTTPWVERIKVIEEDYTIFARRVNLSFSLIVSNPPFFSSGELSPDGKRAAARHESSLSPTALIATAYDLLDPDGILALIVPAQRESELIFEAEMHGLKLRRLCRVSSVEGKSPVRVMMEFSPTDTLQPEISSLSLRSSSGQYTANYSELVKDFYLHF